MNKTANEIQVLDSLRKALGFFEDRTNIVYNSEFRDPETGFVFTSTTDLLNSLHELGIEGKNLKEAGLNLEEWYESLKNQTGTITEIPQYEAQNSTTSFDLETKVEKLEEREAAIKQTRDKAASDVANTQARLKEIYDQQKIIQEQIKKAEELQPKFVGKKVYATVEQQTLVANLEAQKSFETLTQAAIYNEYDLTDQLTAAIREKAGLAESEILVAKTLAVQLVADIARAEETKKELENIAIEEAISQNDGKVLEQVLQQENGLIEVAKKGSVIEAEKLKESVYLTREIAENLFGEDVANEIYGPKQIKVTLSSEQNDQTTHIVDLENSNKASVKSYKERYDFFEKVREGGVDGAKSIFRSQLNSNVNTYLKNKAIEAPKSVLGRLGNSKGIEAILSEGSANPLELKYFGNNKYFGKFLELSPGSKPYFQLFTEVTGVSVGVGVATKIIPLTYGGGGIPLAKIAYIQQVKSLGVPYTLGTKVGGKFAVGLGKRAAAQAAGKIAGQVTTEVVAGTGTGGVAATIATAIGVAAGWVTAGLSLIGAWVSGIIIKNWPKITKWFSENGWIFGVGAGVGGALLFGAGPGLAIGLMATGAAVGFGTLATGAFGVLGYIGRSIGIAIATPVIVTLLVIPPLVAFIMLVINNSAYVVPPAPPSLSNSTNPYINVVKTAEPAGPFENSDLPLDIKYTITITAKKDALTNVTYKDTCKIIQSASNVPCKNASINVPTTISPGSPHIITYTNTYNVFTTDALVVNTFEITATAGEAGEQSTSGAVSIRIGNPPNQCFNIVKDGFSADQYSYVLGAISTLQDSYNGYASKICASLGGNSIDIKYGGTSPNYWGYWSEGYIKIYSRGVANEKDTKYILYHELAHVLATFDDSWYDQYLSYPGIRNEQYPYCFYDYSKEGPPPWPFSERFAEAASFYANDYCGNFKQKNPAHYKFMNDVLFK